jgi:hypothetical protein
METRELVSDEIVVGHASLRIKVFAVVAAVRRLHRDHEAEAIG